VSLITAGRRKGVALIGSVLLATLLLVAACGGNSGTAKASPGKASDTVSWAEPPASTPNWIWPYYTPGNNSVINSELITMMYRPLYMFGHGNNATISDSLSLAQEPSWSADGMTATITMKGTYKWSNGEPVTAQDVLFNLNMYIAEKANEANYVPGYIPDNIVAASAPNATTLVIRTDKAYNQHWFLYNELSQLTPWPTEWDVTGPGQTSDCASNASDCSAVFNYLNAQAKDQSTYDSNPLWAIVDGPWKLKSYNSDGNVSLVPNSSYDGPTKATLKQFNMLPFTTDAAEFNVLKSGKTLDVGYIPTQDLSQPHPSGASPLAAGPNPLSPQYTLSPWFLYGFNYMPLNFNGPQAAIIDQLYIRQALQSLVDQNGIITSQAKGYGVPTLGPVPTVGSADALLSSGEKGNLYPFSVTHAKQYLQENGWTVNSGGTSTCAKPGSAPGDCGPGVASGTPLTFDLPYATGNQTITAAMEDLKSNASQVGINITLRGETFDTVVTNYSTACSSGTSACDWTMANWGGGWVYGPDYYPTGETLFQTGAVSNSGSYTDPQVDQYISQSITTNDTQPFLNYEQALAKNLPVLYQPNYTYALNEIGNGLGGVTPNSPLAFIFPEEWHY
jgi:peptide/nickel transport system substrate-binding protein